MKKIILFVLFMAISAPTFAGMGMLRGIFAGNVIEDTGGDTGSYFGFVNSDGTILSGTVKDTDPSGDSGFVLTAMSSTYSVAPGTGSKQVTELSAYVMNESGYNDLGLAIYDASMNLVCHSVVVHPHDTIGDAAAGWAGGMTATQIVPNPCNITGGSTYHIAVEFENGAVAGYFKTGLTSGTFTVLQDSGRVALSTGFPDPLSGSNPTTAGWAVRARVE